MGSKGQDSSLEMGQNAQSPPARGGLQSSGFGDPFAQADGISLFVVDPQGATGLFGEEEFEGIGTEVEDGSAEGGLGHREF